MTSAYDTPDALLSGLASHGYIAGPALAMSLHLARHLGKPLLVEGPPGVGKTELARATAALLGLPLIRLQCYEGLDEQKALYEWKYGKQLLYTQILRETLVDVVGESATLADALHTLQDFNDLFYSGQFLEPRPLLQALQAESGSVLLIDEIDKSDEEFEAFLLEMLADYQVSIPELGTLMAKVPPLVFLTSNDSRELGDALRRRCLHVHIAFPDAALENRIVASRVPDIDEALRQHLVAFVQSLRQEPLRKAPAISETIEWARALVLLHAPHLERQWVEATLGVLLKHQQDIEHVSERLPALMAGLKR